MPSRQRPGPVGHPGLGERVWRPSGSPRIVAGERRPTAWPSKSSKALEGETAMVHLRADKARERETVGACRGSVFRPTQECPQRDRTRATTLKGWRPGPLVDGGGRPRIPWPELPSVAARAVSSAGRAPALHAGGRRFESCTAHFAVSSHVGSAQPCLAPHAIGAEMRPGAVPRAVLENCLMRAENTRPGDPQLAGARRRCEPPD